MALPRGLIALLLLLALAFALILLLLNYYRPTIEYAEHESFVGLAWVGFWPIGLSAVLAYSPALQRSARLAAAVCAVVALADFLVFESMSSEGIAFAALLASLPILGLFAASRMPTSQRFPWTLLLTGPTAYWLGVAAAAAIYIFSAANLHSR